MVDRNFSDRVVLITGALGGIGMATARAFARRGAKLMLVDLKEASTEQLQSLSAHGAEAVATTACDIGDEAAINELVQSTLDRFERIEVIVNIAGAMMYKPVTDMTGTDWRRMLDINLIGPALLIGAGLNHMKPGSAIVNVSSIHARQTTAEVAGYAAAKAGLCSLTRTAAIEGKHRGVRVNNVVPGAVQTPMLTNSPTIKSGAEKLDPAYVGEPSDIAEITCFLASDAAAFVTGAEILADGGRLAQLS